MKVLPMKIALSGMACALVLSLAALRHSEQGAVRTNNECAYRAEGVSLRPAGGGLNSSDELGSILVTSPALNQRAGVGLSPTQRPRRVIVRTDTQGQHKYWEFSTSFDVLTIAGHGDPSSFFVLGQDPSSEAIVERWVLAYPGGDFLARPTVERTEIYSGTAIENLEFARMGADPEGRFVIITHGAYEAHTRWVTQIYTDAESVVDLADSLAVQELGAAEQPYPVQHVDLGRVWVVDCLAVDKRVIFPDGNNDGIFDSPIVLDQLNWIAQGFVLSDTNPNLYKITDTFR